MEIQNVLSNAVKYRHPDRSCRITLEPAEAPSGQVAFLVTDNGMGIALEHREKVFDLFSRLHTDEEYEGEGIGLALCQRIIAIHGGNIRIEDSPQGGTSFYISLAAG